MQLANCNVALGGDRQTTVPKYGVTAAEIVVLRAIHGPDAVEEIVPAGEISRSNAEELDRLRAMYGGAKDEDNKPIVSGVYPGAGARVHQKLSEIGLPGSFFKATARMNADTEPTAEAEEVAVAAANAQSVSHDDDGIEGVEGGDITPDAPSEDEPAAEQPKPRGRGRAAANVLE